MNVNALTDSSSANDRAAQHIILSTPTAARSNRWLRSYVRDSRPLTSSRNESIDREVIFGNLSNLRPNALSINYQHLTAGPGNFSLLSGGQMVDGEENCYLPTRLETFSIVGLDSEC